MTRTLASLVGGLVAAVTVATASLAAPPTRASVEALYDSMVVTRPAIPTIDVDELTEKMVLVDVRPEEERRVSTLPGAIDLDTLQDRPDTYRDRRLVFFCTLGVRSHDTTRHWAERGFDVANLRGSALAWTHAGRPLVTPEGEPTTRLHTWSRAFALQAEGYQAVY